MLDKSWTINSTQIAINRQTIVYHRTELRWEENNKYPCQWNFYWQWQFVCFQRAAGQGWCASSWTRLNNATNSLCRWPTTQHSSLLSKISTGGVSSIRLYAHACPLPFGQCLSRPWSSPRGSHAVLAGSRSGRHHQQPEQPCASVACARTDGWFVRKTGHVQGCYIRKCHFLPMCYGM